jgi:hypothetical protein
VSGGTSGLAADVAPDCSTCSLGDIASFSGIPHDAEIHQGTVVGSATKVLTGKVLIGFPSKAGISSLFSIRCEPRAERCFRAERTKDEKAGIGSLRLTVLEGDDLSDRKLRPSSHLLKTGNSRVPIVFNLGENTVCFVC